MALVRFMRYLHSTKLWHKTLTADNLRVMKWWIDASFAVHPDFKSHTGSVMSMGSGAAQVMSRKQKLVSRSSTEAELIAVDDVITMVLWTKLLLERQPDPINECNLALRIYGAAYQINHLLTITITARFRYQEALSE